MMRLVAFASRHLRRFSRNEYGGAAEFAMVVPAAGALILGAINMGFMMYAGATLHYPAEDAARCRAVGMTCTDATTTQTYAEGRYKGPVTNPNFTSTLDATCSTVSATATFSFNVGLADFDIPINASACYPVQPSAT
jgi:Flp pilus assembly protein TadG